MSRNRIIEVMATRGAYLKAVLAAVVGAFEHDVNGVFLACAYYALMPELRPLLKSRLTEALRNFRDTPLVKENSLEGQLANFLKNLAEVVLDTFAVADLRRVGDFLAGCMPFRLARVGYTLKALYKVP